MPFMMGGGQHIPAGLSYPPPKTLEQWLCTKNENDFKCYISENYENTLKFGYFPACLQQPVTKNALDDGWRATYPSWFILPPTHDFLALTGYDFDIAVNCFNNYKLICFTKYRYCLLV